jgi:chloramphenicol 3-O-phosphotransferase
MSQIVILSGPSGAGKSSVAESLCERYDRTVHIKMDDFYESIRMGRINPMRPESNHQNIMVTRAAARAASAYAQDLFAVFIDGVIGTHLLPVYVDELRDSGVAVHFVLLMPTLEETLARVAPRDSRRQMPLEKHRALYAQFERYGAFAGCVVDTTGLTPDQSADIVMARCGEGACLVRTART